MRKGWANAGVVAGISALIALVSQAWSGFNSPDSEFYASFASFGAPVADRAVEVSYYWTRLGYITPVRGLVSVLGPWWGFGIWRFFLIVLVVGSVFAMVHVAGRSRVLGAALAAFVGANTVVLAYLGNTYVSGTAIAVMFVLLAVGVTYLGSAAARGRGIGGTPRWCNAALAGALVGWLVMINPYAAILGGGMWCAVRAVAVWKIRTERVCRLGVDALAALIGACVAFLAFLLTGLLLFPGRSWLGTYLEWNERLDYSAFIGDATTWQRDSALAVVVVALIVSLTAVISHPRRRWAWAALAISGANIMITLVLMAVMTGPWLEAPHYVALLWPGALTSLILVFTALAPGTHEGKQLHRAVIAIAAVLTFALLVWSGRFERDLGADGPWLAITWGLAAAVCGAVIVIAVITRTRWNRLVAIALMVVIGATFITAQVWQNGRGPLGIYGQYPLRTAYVDFNFDDQFASKLAIEEWLLERTTDADRIGVWTDPAGLAADVAAMQMWGDFNLITKEPELTRESTEALEVMRPNVVAAYAPVREQIDRFAASLPPWAMPSEPECRSEPYLGVGTGEVVACLIRLRWVG